jgi:hypothetical protein
VVCGRVPKFGSRISLPGKLVPEFNYFKKLQVFEFSNPVGSHQFCSTFWIWREESLKWWDSSEQPLKSEQIFFEKGEMLPINWFLDYIFGFWTHIEALTHAQPLVSLKRSLPGAGWGMSRDLNKRYS